MQAYTQKIREAAKRLLTDKSVDVVIGFRKGTVPFQNEPVLVRSPDQVDRLWWDGNCGVNLANYLPKRTDKVAIVAKGCDTRSIAVQIVENQIKREQVYIIGVPCKGMIDRAKATNNGGAEVLQENCSICIHRNPVIYDELVADPVPEQDVDRYEDVRKVEAMSAEERWQYFDDLVSNCIRCYACRNSCPACYCSDLLRRRVPPAVGREEHRSDGHPHLSLSQGFPRGRPVYGLRRVRTGLPGGDQGAPVHQEAGERREGTLRLRGRDDDRRTAASGCP